MCGFAAAAPYAVYVTDFVCLWYDAPTPQDVTAEARRLGVLDFTTGHLDRLVSDLAQHFDEVSVAANDGKDSLRATVALSLSLAWRFSLPRASPERAASFFAALAARQLVNHDYLLSTLRAMEAVVAAKDNYITYLEENYKTINGSDLLDKYRKQHPSELNMLNARRRSHLEMPILPPGGLWDSAHRALQDTSTWKAKEHDHVIIDLEPGPSSADQIGSNSPDQIEPNSPEEITDPAESPNAEKRSPEKRSPRKRVGIIGRTQRSSSPASHSVPQKRRRVGPIRRN